VEPVYNNSSSTEPALWRIVPGANGGLAQRVSWGTNNTTRRASRQWTVSVVYASSASGTPSLFLARATDRTRPVQIGTIRQLRRFPANHVIVAQPTLTAAWQRYIFQFWNPGTAAHENSSILVRRNAGGTVGLVSGISTSMTC
jgi:hypothetical protein